MDEAVARFCDASLSRDIDGMMATLAPGAELVSPVSGHLVFRGTEDLRLLLTAVYGGLIAGWPVFVRAALVTVPVTALMTWVVMPRAARALATWLYGPPRRP